MWCERRAAILDEIFHRLRGGPNSGTVTSYTVAMTLAEESGIKML